MRERPPEDETRPETGPSPPEPSPGPDGNGDGPGWREHWLRPLFTDPSLWPLLSVGVGILGTFLAGMLLFGLVERRWPALGALAAVLWLTLAQLAPDLRRRRLGPASGLLLAIWGLAALLAFGAVRIGIF